MNEACFIRECNPIPNRPAMYGEYTAVAGRGNLTDIKNAMASMMLYAARENGDVMPRAYSIIIKTREFAECETPTDLMKNLNYPSLTVGIKWHMDKDLPKEVPHDAPEACTTTVCAAEQDVCGDDRKVSDA